LLVATLQALGIEVWGWIYTYGYSPASEARMAIRCIKESGVTGLVANAEVEWKRMSNPGPSVRALMTPIRAEVGNDFPIALSSYRYPRLHAQFPFVEFLEYCDFNMPQIYWLLQHNPVWQLEESIRQYQALRIWRPMIPTGCAWKIGTWIPTPSDVVAFMDAARRLGLEAANYWSWQHTEKLPALWQTIAEYDWPVDEPEEPEIPEDEMGEVLDKLNLVLGNQALILAKLNVDPEEPEPDPDPEPPAQPKYMVRLTGDKANARFVYRMKNETVPIFQIYPGDSKPVSERIQYLRNQTPLLEVDPNRVRGDGSMYCYKLIGRYGRGGEQLYIWSEECVKTW